MINKLLIRYSPPGMNLSQEKNFIIWGMSLSVIYSVFYWLGNYIEAYNRLFIREGGRKILNTNAVMLDFRALIGKSLIGFVIVAFIMLGFIIYHYIYYRQGSKPIYLMKRLPRKSEMHIRALAIPFGVIILSFITAFILLLIYFAIYMIATPKVCIQPEQWHKLWRITL